MTQIEEKLSKEQQSPFVPHEFWKNLPGLASYINFLETCQRCLAKMLDTLMSKNYKSKVNQWSSNETATLDNLLDAIYELDDLLKHAQPYSLNGTGVQQEVFIDYRRLPVKVSHIKKLSNSVTESLKKIDPSILFSAILNRN